MQRWLCALTTIGPNGGQPQRQGKIAMRMKCAFCDDKDCYAGKDCCGMRDELQPVLLEKENNELLRIAAALEADHYMQLTRVEETLLFARNLGVERIGVAFCVGLSNEARRFCEIAEAEGFTTASVCCKICGIDKHAVGLKKLWNREVEATCNPIGQAEVLNKCETGINVAIGLCVGHDSLFFKYSKAPTTVLVAKDRVLAHNPAGALYSNYYKRRFNKEMESLKNRKE